MVETQSSNRKIILLGVAALLFALVVVVIALTTVLRGGSEEGAVSTQAARLMPADVFAFATFNPHLGQARHYDVIERAWGDNPQVKQALSEMLSQMATEGLDYQADIAPWLGNEIAIGIGADLLDVMATSMDQTFADVVDALEGVPPSAPMPTWSETGPLLIVAVSTQDKDASDRLLSRLVDKAEVTPETRTYQDVEYTYLDFQPDESPGVAWATIDDYVVLVAGGPQAIEAVIDAREGENLAGNEYFDKVLSKLPPDAVGYGYVDMDAYAEMLTDMMSSPEMGEVSGLVDVEQFKAFHGVGVAVNLVSNGLQMDVVATYDPELLPEALIAIPTNPHKTAARVPQETLIYASSTMLGYTVQTMLDTLATMPDAPEDFDESLTMLTSFLGLTQDELIEMLSGEMGLALTYEPAGLGGDPNVPIGLSFLLEASDADKFERLVNGITTLLTMSAGVTMEEETINGVTVSTLPNPDTGELLIGFGVGQEFLAVGTSEALLESAFGGGGAALADDATYKAAIAPLPDANTGILFINVERTLDVLKAAMGPAEREGFAEVEALLSPLKAISAATQPYSKGRDTVKGTFFVLIESE